MHVIWGSLTEWGWTIFICTAFLSIPVYAIRRNQFCHCGKSKPSILLFPNHYRVRLLVARAIVSSIALGVAIATNERPPDSEAIFTGVWVVFAMMDWLAVWYHEKDKLKKAAKALGRVKVLSNGRLAVVKS